MNGSENRFELGPEIEVEFQEEAMVSRSLLQTLIWIHLGPPVSAKIAQMLGLLMALKG